MPARYWENAWVTDMTARQRRRISKPCFGEDWRPQDPLNTVPRIQSRLCDELSPRGRRRPGFTNRQCDNITVHCICAHRNERVKVERLCSVTGTTIIRPRASPDRWRWSEYRRTTYDRRPAGTNDCGFWRT